MQQPTIAELRVRTTADALIIFHAVRHDMLPMVRRRLDADERRSIKSGDVFVWEERCNAEASGVGIIMQTSHMLYLSYYTHLAGH